MSSRIGWSLFFWVGPEYWLRSYTLNTASGGNHEKERRRKTEPGRQRPERVRKNGRERKEIQKKKKKKKAAWMARFGGIPREWGMGMGGVWIWVDYGFGGEGRVADGGMAASSPRLPKGTQA